MRWFKLKRGREKIIERVRERRGGHHKGTWKSNAIIRNLTTNDNSSGAGSVINCLQAGVHGLARVRGFGGVTETKRRCSQVIERGQK